MDSEQSSLEQLRKHTIIVSDTGEINLIKKVQPKDATTNPSLITKACELPEYQDLVNDAITYATNKLNTKDGSNKELMSLILDKLAVNFGLEILKIVEGYVSTEVDARLSFDKENSLTKARRIISLYEEAGIKRNRILIKLAATWEGIKAAEILEKEGISCNLTLIFNLTQAVACAEANVTLVSPFVGRINDGHAKKLNCTFEAHNEPGIAVVRNIYNYYKKFGHKTIVMAASLRTPESTLELTGCDRITMPPGVIEKLSNAKIPAQLKLSEENAKKENIDKIESTEQRFRWDINEDEIANDKLSDGIRLFTKDIIKLEKIIKEKLAKL